MKSLPAEFIHKDHRRSLSQLVTDDLKQVNLYEVHKGAILGNHYHKITNEYFYIIKGSFLLNVNGKSQVISRGSFFVVEPPERHTLECLSLTGSFLTFLTKPYSKEDTDTYK